MRRWQIWAPLQVAGSGAACVALVDGDVSALKASLSHDVLQAELGDAMHTQLLLPDTLVRLPGLAPSGAIGAPPWRTMCAIAGSSGCHIADAALAGPAASAGRCC